ncbi:sigma-54-dependent Fis family transcriptional regulator [Pelomonas sp. KK5]|uniref:sigma-54-dependent Fis family transcriptional regulator n=1 Tax=Pelomonas sp. KK5 TaxID=1855730 RepID=UPI00097BDD2C|nr:sigma-54-dependent Fis family transcriptional regulator [Pelomonas sp. KK5]
MSSSSEEPGASAELAVRAPRQDLIQRSHQRSAALGLTRGERREFGPLIRSDLNLARERNQRLCNHAAPVMQLLLEQIVHSESMIVLTDAQGTILHTVGDDDFLQRADKVALAPGANWAEHSKGTNAIGTALFEEVATLVHAHEHYMHANHFLTCSAVPIFDPRGNVLGVLDVTGDQRGYHQHTMGLVRMSARMIENHWLSDDFNSRVRLHFHAHAAFIGSLLEGIVVMAPDGRIVGANRAAMDLLGLSGAALRAQSVMSLFGTTPSAIHDHFSLPMPAPMRLALPGGQVLHAMARCEWPARALALGGVERAAMPPAVAPQPCMPIEQPHLDLQYLRTGDAQVELLVGKLRRVVNRDIPLLVLGETGTGKELLARAVHNESNRARQPFVAVNCASIPESLIESELFGYEDGAFTGARRKGAVGRIVQANGGTLFLDEIGDMPLPLQARLLRVLQERSVTPLGSSKAIPVDIALIGATHRNLREMIEAQTFREDLYYRLNGLALRLPALRDRSDLEALVRRILLAERPQDPPELSPQVLDMFRRYAWPGNIRQLANVLRTAAVMSAGERQITPLHLSDDFLEEARGPGRAPAPVFAMSMTTPVGEATPAEPPPPEPPATLEKAELAMIRAALAATDGNVSAAAKQLGISRNTIYRKLRGEP